METRKPVAFDRIFELGCDFVLVEMIFVSGILFYENFSENEDEK